MKACRAAVISSANFSGSEDRNNPGYRCSTGMNRVAAEDGCAYVHTRDLLTWVTSGRFRGCAERGGRPLVVGYKMRNELRDVPLVHRCVTECMSSSLFFLSLFAFSSVFFSLSPFLFSRCVARLVGAGGRGWFATCINKIVADASRRLTAGARALAAGIRGK